LILTCERCETRFRLDESRLPATGARVRCSRCKHAFFVRPPGAPNADAIQELAEQAAVTGRPAPPEPSWDLRDAAASRTAQRSARPASPNEAPADFENESDWRFEDEVPALGDSGASLDLPNGEAPAAPTALDANESSFAELGDPESWDLLANASEDITATRAAVAAPAGMPVVARSEASVTAAGALNRASIDAYEEEPDAIRAPLPMPTVDLSPGMRLGGWMAVGALVAGVALMGLLPISGSPPARLDTVSVGPLAVTELVPRLVDHALAGPIWVVSGELHNPGTEARVLGAAVGVTLVDAKGAPIEGAVATAAPPVPTASLREVDPDRLREEAAAAAAALAQRVIAPGERVAIEAVFASAPRSATRFALTPQPVTTRMEPVEPRPTIEPESPATPESAPEPAASVDPAAPS
jgi:predicted Zn finger-like uncharacterized protein